jgi:hypothetical protein
MSRASNETDSISVDVLAVRAVALDYIEGWYTGDAERMARSLHNDLVKRTPVQADTSTATELRLVTKDRMIELTRAGGGSDVADPAIEVFVDDVTEDIACARTVCAGYLDYLHIAKTAEGWRIVNILFRSLS